MAEVFGQDDEFADEQPQIPERGAMVQPGMPGYRDEYGNLADPFERFKQSWRDAPGNIDSAARAAARGMSFGGADYLAGKVNEMTGMPIYPGGDTVEEQQMTTAQGIDELGAPGRLAEVAGAMVPGMLVPGSATSTAARALMTGAVTGAAGTTAQSYFDTGDLPPAGEIAVGTILGAALSGAGYAIGKTVQRPRLNPTQEENVNLLQREGVDVFSGQATNDMAQMRKEAAATGAFEKVENQKAQYSKAILRRAGIHSDTGRLDPDTLNQTFDITGQRMDALAARNHMQFQMNLKTGRVQIMDDLRDIAKDYYNSVEAKPAPIIKNTLKEMGKHVAQGVLPGPKFQEITSALEAAARTNPNLAPTVREMRATINKAMEDYIVSTNQADAGLWQAVNKQYANLLIVENALGKLDANTANGLLSPRAVAAATQRIKGKRNYVRGRTDFDDLTRAGIAAMPELPINSYAPPSELSKMLARKIAMYGSSGGMAGMGGFTATGSPMMGMAAGAAGIAIPELASMATSGLRLRPVNSLSPNSASMGGRIGAALGGATGAEVNPFLKANGQ